MLGAWKLFQAGSSLSADGVQPELQTNYNKNGQWLLESTVALPGCTELASGIGDACDQPLAVCMDEVE
jgi:hypothetical protein